MTPDERHAHVLRLYTDHVNPYLARLMNFAGFGVEAHAEGCYITDYEGRRYLDCLGGYGVYSLGHRHPVVIEAVKRQLDVMPMSGRALFNERLAELAARLAGLAPGDLSLAFFSNSGAEAVEAALKFAKGTTGREKIVSTDGGYHGKTIGALSVTGREKYRKPFLPLMPGAAFVPFGDAGALDQAVDDRTAAVILEPIQGEGGIHVPPDGYLAAARRACDRHGALLIFDEVQTGLGRTGAMFGCDHEGVAPDVMTLAKALGGGVMPIGATLFTPRIGEAIYAENPLMHTSTFGGNPLACAAALATLDVIEAEGLIENARQVGARLRGGLEKAAAAHPALVGEVRGRGLILGVEFTMDDVGELVIAQMVKRGLLAAYTLNNRRVIRFEPPLILTERQADFAAEIFGDAVAETEKMVASLV
jgi:putrescine aminotransferase